MLFQPITAMHQVSKITFAPSNPICGEWRAGKSCTWTGAEITAQGCEPLGDVALHLRAKHQFGRGGSDRVLDREVIVGDERLDPAARRLGSDISGEFTGIAAEAADLETQFFARDPRGGDRVGRIAEDEDALGGEVGRIDRSAPPREPGRGVAEGRRGICTCQLGDVGDEGASGSHADRDGPHRGLSESALKPAGASSAISG